MLALDITDADSIARAIEQAGPLDALVNNAGFGAPVPVELTPMDTARALFETNTLGTLAMTQAVLPQLRERGAGVIVNVTSSVTLMALPLVGVYSASKAAVNAFTQSLAIEVEPFGVRVRLGVRYHHGHRGQQLGVRLLAKDRHRPGLQRPGGSARGRDPGGGQSGHVRGARGGGLRGLHLSGDADRDQRIRGAYLYDPADPAWLTPGTQVQCR